MELCRGDGGGGALRGLICGAMPDPGLAGVSMRGGSDGSGRRVLRDLEHSEDMFGRPRCDVALPELTILLGREKPLMDFRTSSTGTLMVELFPGVHTSIRWQRNSDFQQETFDRRDSSAETRALVRELSSALERVELIRRRLAQQVDLEPDLPSHTDSERRPKRR